MTIITLVGDFGRRMASAIYLLFCVPDQVLCSALPRFTNYQVLRMLSLSFCQYIYVMRQSEFNLFSIIINGSDSFSVLASNTILTRYVRS